MQAKLIQMLTAHDYVKTGESVKFSVRGYGNWGILAFVNLKHFYHIKINFTGELLNEYHNLIRLAKLYPEYIPYPLDYIEHDGREYMICQAYLHRTFTSRQIEHNHAIQQMLQRYFFATLKYAPKSDPKKQSILERLPVLEGTEPNIIKHLTTLHDKLQGFGVHPQHGDFVLNNVAMTGKSLIIFDWEDYQRVNYAGFDLAIFLLSLYQFEAQKLHMALQSTHHLDTIVKNYLDALNLSKTEFLSFMPLYLYAFMKLKKDYGYAQEAIDRTQRAFMYAIEQLK